jgi:signal transduction histidine kinase
MGTVVKEAQRLGQLITDLLTFARPSDGRLTDFDLADLMQEVIDFLTPQANEAGVALQIEDRLEPTEVHSDRDGLKQVLLNVILNAVEATPDQGKVHVSIDRNGKGRQAKVEIRDDGPGPGNTDPEELSRPFKITKLKGNGLGLAVSRRIVDRLDGTIRLNDAPKGGTLCTLRIPIRSADPKLV